jgi:hypothetical protein
MTQNWRTQDLRRVLPALCGGRPLTGAAHREEAGLECD